MAKRTVSILSPKQAREISEVHRRVLSDGGSSAVTPYGGSPADLWGEVVSSVAFTGKTNQYVYTLKLFTNPFLEVANCIPKADGTAATHEALNTTERRNTASVGSEYTLNASATTCDIYKSVRPIAPSQTRYPLKGPYKHPDVADKFYYAFTARNDPKFGDEA